MLASSSTTTHRLIRGAQIYGDFTDISIGHEQIFAYTRALGNATALVILNFKGEERAFELDPEQDWRGLELVLGNYPDTTGSDELGSRVMLRGYEGRLYIR